MDENFISTQIIKEREYKRGFEDGKKARDKELEIKRGEEIEVMYQDSLKAEEIMENTDTLEEKAERLEDEEFARKADWDALAEKQR